MYEAYVTTLKNVKKHSNADRLQVAECFGNQVIIDLSFKEGDIGVYFPVDGKGTYRAVFTVEISGTSGETDIIEETINCTYN